ncbi:MAG: family 43 glycosylhydrolase [Christensenellales bacterium]|jgi:beta-xylosidase
MTDWENGGLWRDTSGELIHAHGGHMLFHEGWYYWYGEDRRENGYASVYRSKDLTGWEFRNHILRTDSPTAPVRQRTCLQLTRPDGGKVNLERPKVLYNALLGKFVLWAHYENGLDYLAAGCAVATCDTPDGDFVYHGWFNPYGYMSRDCTLFQDEDGTAYFISAARDNADMHVYRLSADYLNIDALVARLWPGEYREAPAVFRKDGLYYMLSSYCTGWAPNQGRYASAPSMAGPWTMLENFGDATTYDTQPAFILPLGEDFVYVADRWDGQDYFNSRYVFLPIQVEAPGRLSVPNVARFALDVGGEGYIAR